VPDGLDLTTLELLLALGAGAAGAVVQGVLAFGYALVVVPALLLVAPETVPVTPLVVAFPMVLRLAFTERRGLDRGGFARLTAGRIPGTAVGAWVLTVVSTDTVAVVAGALLLFAVAASTATKGVRTTPRVEVAAGFASGVAGTVGAIGGPAMALAYQDRPGDVLRATISLAFAVGVVVSLAAIGLAGRIEQDDVVLGLMMIPAPCWASPWAGGSPHGSRAAGCGPRSSPSRRSAAWWPSGAPCSDASARRPATQTASRLANRSSGTPSGCRRCSMATPLPIANVINASSEAPNGSSKPSDAARRS
jgi:uncharacterized membrane protein YfcA